MRHSLAGRPRSPAGRQRTTIAYLVRLVKKQKAPVAGQFEILVSTSSIVHRWSVSPVPIAGVTRRV